MLDLPYKSISKIDHNKNYTVMLTYLPLAKYRALLGFMIAVIFIMKQLNKSKGCVGYTMRARILKKEFYTLSIWESKKDLYAFVAKRPHRKSMTDMKGKMGKTAFYEWEINGNELPLTWDEAFNRANI